MNWRDAFKETRRIVRAWDKEDRPGLIEASLIAWGIVLALAGIGASCIMFLTLR